MLSGLAGDPVDVWFQECRDLSEEVELLKETVEEKDGRMKQLQTDLARHERGIESGE